MSETLSRRQWIERGLLVTAGAAFSQLGKPIAGALSRVKSKEAVASASQPFTAAVSLSMLQRTA